MTPGFSMDAAAPRSGPPNWLSPVAWLGRSIVETVGHLGGTAVLLASAAWSFVRPSDDADDGGAWSATLAELTWMLRVGCPLVALVHVAMGSFLSLQAYYGSTFVDGTGAVVGVGLLRNLAPLMTGLAMAGFLPVRVVPELLEIQRRRLDGAPAASPGRLAAPRLLAGSAAAPLLALWGFVVGTLVGWQSSQSLMRLPSEMFFMMFVRMIWYRDVVGVLVKGALFGFFTAGFACSEGLRRAAAESDRDAAADVRSTCGAAILRAACLSMAAILVVNMTWFILIYHAAPVYGPSLLQPPTP